MKHLQRRLTKLEGVLLDPVGLVPYSQRWLEYWDRQYFLFLSGQDKNATRRRTPEVFRAVMKYAEESPTSLVGSIPDLSE